MIKNSKLVLLLESLDEKELQNFGRFLKSPYFNQDERLIKLLKSLAKFHPNISDRFKDKLELFCYVFPNEKYNEKNFRYLLSDLNGLAEQFLGVQSMRRQSLEVDIRIMDELSKRNLKKAYQNKVRQFDKKLEGASASEREKLQMRLKFEELKQRHFERSHVRKLDYTVQRLSQLLDRYYFLYRLHLSCAMLDHQAIFGESYNINLSNEWIEHLVQKSYFDHPLAKIYYTVYQALIEDEQEGYFDQLKFYLDQEKKDIFQEDLRDIFLFAINYCARKIRKGRSNYVAEALDLYVNGIDSKVLLEEGQLTPWTFTNVVKLSLKLERYDWVQQFINNYKSKLLPEFRENAIRFNRAELFYALYRYEDAQRELIKVAHSDLNYYLGARVLLAKIYFETKEEEALLSLLASFTIFLKRNSKISKNIKLAGLNFCTILFQIVKHSPNSLNKVHERMSRMDLLTERKWLQEICGGE